MLFLAFHEEKKGFYSDWQKQHSDFLLSAFLSSNINKKNWHKLLWPGALISISIVLRMASYDSLLGFVTFSFSFLFTVSSWYKIVSK